MLGAIDGSLVPLIAPSENEPVYVSRKGYHAINVQGIMNAELLPTNVVARWPGSRPLRMTPSSYLTVQCTLTLRRASIQMDGSWATVATPVNRGY